MAPAAAGAGLADHVHVFAGTRPGHDTFGGGHNFPGASAPFGMVQWSPDTTPADRNGRGGYDYRDSHIKGFSLTHLSGAGCSLYGDFPFLPTTEPIDDSPAAGGSSLDGQFQPGFSHAHESGRPGYYSVRLNPVRGGAIDTELTATTRTGMARFTFPRNPHASVLINAGGSAQPDDFAAVSIDPARREIDGTASSGLFCGQRPRYRVYIAAVFDRALRGLRGLGREQARRRGGPRRATARRRRPTRRPAPRPAPTRASTPAATAPSPPASASPSSASRTLVPTSPPKIRAAASARSPGEAERRWNSWLGRIRVRGGPPRLLDTFYTALYHVGSGAAHLQRRRWRLHRHGRAAAPGRGPYPVRRLLRLGHLPHPDPAALDPRPQARQRDGALAARRRRRERLPAALVLRQRPEHDHGRRFGRPADRLRGGLRRHAPSTAKRRSPRCCAAPTSECRSANGEYLERQGLAPYLAHGYVPFDLDTNVRNANSIYGSPDDVWGSAATSLEYTVDDFAIAQFAARALRRPRPPTSALCSVQATGASSSTAAAA